MIALPRNNMVYRLLTLLALLTNGSSDAFSNNLAANTNTNPPKPSSSTNLEVDPESPALPPYVPVAIIGGGLGGLAVCAALQRRGIKAHVFESSPELLRDSTGTGIMISTNGLTALECIDERLPGLMRDSGCRIVRQHISISDSSGDLTRDKILFQMTSEQINIGWSRAQEVLASVVDDSMNTVHCGARFQSYRESTDDNNDDGHGTVEIQFEDGRTVQTSLLIGADGAGSKLRRILAHENANTAHTQKTAAKSYETRYNGQLLWNALIPTAAISPQFVHRPGEVEYITCGNDGQVVLAFDAGQDQTSWYLTLMENNKDSFLEETRAALEGSADGSTSFGGFGRRGVKKQLEQSFREWPLALACLEATPESQIFERRLSDKPPLMEWTPNRPASKGRKWGKQDDTPISRVVLMGDAAHPMIPSQGQGTMMTWEDAADLATLVSPHLTETTNDHTPDSAQALALSEALHAFVAARAERCARVQKYSAQSYMGRRSSRFFPKQLFRMKNSMAQMKFVKNGYEPVTVP